MTARALFLAEEMLTASAGQLGFCAEHAATNGSALKYEEPRFLTGKIYAKDGHRRTVLFNFTRRAVRSGAELRVVREYTYPDGKLAARERLAYVGDDLVSFELEELQIGARGRAEIRRVANDHAKARIWFEYAKDPLSVTRPKTDSEPLQKEALVNDMVAPFLAAHWDELVRGREVKCRYIVVPRTETVGFTFKRAPESAQPGGRVVVIKMEATSPVIAALVDPLFFTLERDPPHRVLQYSGRVTPKIQSSGKWKDLDAVTVFDWK